MWWRCLYACGWGWRWVQTDTLIAVTDRQTCSLQSPLPYISLCGCAVRVVLQFVRWRRLCASRWRWWGQTNMLIAVTDRQTDMLIAILRSPAWLCVCVQCEWFFSSWDEDVYVPVDEDDETDRQTDMLIAILCSPAWLCVCAVRVVLQFMGWRRLCPGGWGRRWSHAHLRHIPRDDCQGRNPRYAHQSACYFHPGWGAKCCNQHFCIRQYVCLCLPMYFRNDINRCIVKFLLCFLTFLCPRNLDSKNFLYYVY